MSKQEWEANLDGETAKILAQTRQVTGYDLKEGPYTVAQLKQLQRDVLSARRN